MKYYLDTEFNGHLGELISLALVAEDGRELYLLNIDRLENNVDWVRENVIPILMSPGADPVCQTQEQISYEIGKFLAHDSHPHIIVDWPDDIKYFCEAIITGPGEMIEVPRLQFDLVRIDAYPTKLPGAVQHNALWDARALQFAINRKDTAYEPLHFDKWQPAPPSRVQAVDDGTSCTRICNDGSGEGCNCGPPTRRVQAVE